jgi:hypothetical protein
MSAPQTDPDKQIRRHRTPLVGMALCVIVVALGYFAYTTWIVAEAPAPATTAPEATATTGN